MKKKSKQTGQKPPSENFEGRRTWRKIKRYLRNMQSHRRSADFPLVPFFFQNQYISV